MSVVRQLYQLQLVDSEWDEKHHRLAAIDQSLGDDREVVRAQEAVAETEAALDKLRAQLRSLELEVSGLNDKLRKNQERLYGGKVRIATDARLDDGLLDVNVFAGTGFSSAVRTALGVVTGLHVRDPRHSFYRGSAIHIEADRPMPVHVDGEPFGTTPLVCEVMPKALSVLVPQHTRPELFAG